MTFRDEVLAFLNSHPSHPEDECIDAYDRGDDCKCHDLCWCNVGEAHDGLCGGADCECH